MTDVLNETMTLAFEAAGYDGSFGAVKTSDRPDLCEFQCNGAMAAAKAAHKAPFAIAEEVIARLDDETSPFTAEVVRPGFINLKLKDAFLLETVRATGCDADLGIVKESSPKKIIIDYGGPNVAKPLHVGHLRPAVIGESIKRICRAAGNEVLGDVHLGDWGMPMGLIIAELKCRKPELPYFAEGTKDFPEEAPFTISELEEIYPFASAKSKEDEAFRAEALEATKLLQEGYAPYRALWQHIIRISVADLKKNYEKLKVDFDLWKAESDADPYIPGMVNDLKERGIAHIDQGALIVDVSEESDKKEVPPCIILKSDGAALYSTTDLATIIDREKLYKPDAIIYVVDKRQALHFTQVFRTARKAGFVPDTTELIHVGFGTLNGKDGHALKTRDGGVLRLEALIADVEKEMKEKILANKNVRESEADDTAKKVALAALKYGDLSNQASKDYIFDIDKFASFEGNTGPYILYTIVRCKSILRKASDDDRTSLSELPEYKGEVSPSVRSLMLTIAGFGNAFEEAYRDLAPHRICAYMYQLANDFNRFYHDTVILQEHDETKRRFSLGLLKITSDILTKCIDLLGFDAPENM